MYFLCILQTPACVFLWACSRRQAGRFKEKHWGSSNHGEAGNRSCDKIQDESPLFKFPWFLPHFPSFLVFSSVNFWDYSNVSVFALNPGMLTITTCKVHNITTVHRCSSKHILNAWCMLPALLFQGSYLMLQLIKCSWCIIFCWNTNLNCLWKNTHEIISCLIFFFTRCI